MVKLKQLYIYAVETRKLIRIDFPKVRNPRVKISELEYIYERGPKVTLSLREIAGFIARRAY